MEFLAVNWSGASVPADCGNVEAARLPVQHGADLTVRARVPGHYKRLDEFVETTVLGYARRFPVPDRATVRYLEGVGAGE